MTQLTHRVQSKIGWHNIICIYIETAFRAPHRDPATVKGPSPSVLVNDWNDGVKPASATHFFSGTPFELSAAVGECLRQLMRPPSPF
jgi:hypothetical protein